MANHAHGLGQWPLWRQLESGDLEGLGENAYSPRSRELSARTVRADRVVSSVCPYCAVGCGQTGVRERRARSSISKATRDSPISHGCLCPKGAATFQLVTGSHREHHVLYRRPHATAVGDRFRWSRPWTWWPSASSRRAIATGSDDRGRRSRCTAPWRIAHLGGATLDNEENYLIKKLFTALGIVQIENQARI